MLAGKSILLEAEKEAEKRRNKSLHSMLGSTKTFSKAFWWLFEAIRITGWGLLTFCGAIFTPPVPISPLCMLNSSYKGVVTRGMLAG